MDLTLLDNCPLAIQNNNLNIKNHLKTIAEHGLGPANPLEPNHEFWQAKAVMWGISEGDARGRLCANCEYYYDNEQIRSCIENGPAKNLKASELPIEPKWTDIESQPVGYCEKFDITCSPTRTCDEQEILEREEMPEEGDEEDSNPVMEYEDLTKSSLED